MQHPTLFSDAPQAQRLLSLVITDLATDQRVHKTCLSLQQLGWAPKLVGIKRANSPALTERPYEAQRVQVRAQRGWRFYAAVNRKLLWHALRMPCHTILANDVDVLPAAYLAARLKGCRLLLDAHELFSEQHEVAKRPRVQRFWRWLEHWLVPKAQGMSMVNAGIAQAFAAQLGSRMPPVHIVHNYPLAYTPPRLPKLEDKVLLYQGNLQQGRGLELVLHALQGLAGWRLRIIGDGYHRPVLEALVQQLGLTERVEFMGRLPFVALQEHTYQASLGLSLEHGTGVNVEWVSPNKVHDYIQARLPMLTTPLPNFLQLFNEHSCGRAVEQRADALAEAVAGVTPTLYAQWQQACEAAAQKLQWQANLPALEALYGRPQ